MEMKKKNTVRKAVWGIFLVGAAVLIIANAYYSFTSLLPLLCIIVVLPVMVESLIHLSFTGVFIPAALLCIMFSSQLGLDKITPWPVLAAAVLLSIGFSIIFRKHDKWLNQMHFETDASFENITDDEMTCTVRFGEGTKYIMSENFEGASLNCQFGAIKAYFDNAKLSPNGAELNVNASFSGVELFIPKHWKVASSLNAFLGGVEEKSRNAPDPDSPLLTLTGNVSFAGIVIYYI